MCCVCVYLVTCRFAPGRQRKARLLQAFGGDASLDLCGEGKGVDVSTRVSPVELVREERCHDEHNSTLTGTHNCSDGELLCATHCHNNRAQQRSCPFRLALSASSPGDFRPAKHALYAGDCISDTPKWPFLLRPPD
jgi:hypothetical protein